MKVDNMFESPLRALKVAGVMTLFAFPAGASSHDSHMTLEMENRSGVTIIEVCIGAGFTAYATNPRVRFPGECHQDLDWVHGAMAEFSVLCVPGNVYVDYFMIVTLQTGEIRHAENFLSHCTPGDVYLLR